jgi:tetratricopeptide (TPR) repeat protein
MGTTIRQGFGVFVLGVALVMSEAFAQTTGAPVEIRSRQPGTAVVSADLLRHPMSSKVRQRLTRVMEIMDSGAYEIAIEQLTETLKKYPDSTPYVQGLLGVVYVKTGRFDEAVSSFEQAVAVLSHDAMTHYNFALALVCAGDYDRAGQEMQRALDLDPTNLRIQARLNALLARKR